MEGSVSRGNNLAPWKKNNLVLQLANPVDYITRREYVTLDVNVQSDIRFTTMRLVHLLVDSATNMNAKMNKTLALSFIANPRNFLNIKNLCFVVPQVVLP